MTFTFLFSYFYSEPLAVMSDYLGKDMRKVRDNDNSSTKENVVALDEADIALLRTYGTSRYAQKIKKVEDSIQATLKRVNELTGIKVKHGPSLC